MEIKVAKDDKHDVELLVNSVTVSEILRVYLYKSGVDFAAWRREHPSKPLVFKIASKDSTVSKVVGSAVNSIKKDCAAWTGLLKK